MTGTRPSARILFLIALVPIVTTLPVQNATVSNQTMVQTSSCVLTRPANNDVWRAGRSYEIDWHWSVPKIIKSDTSGVVMLEKLNSDGTWERVGWQPAVKVKIYRSSKVQMKLVSSSESNTALTVKVTLATEDYNSEKMCDSEEFTVTQLSSTSQMIPA